MFPRQARSLGRQIGLPNAQDDQALLDPNLHCVISEPNPIVSLRLGTREFEQPATQQPQSPAGPMRCDGRESEGLTKVSNTVAVDRKAAPCNTLLTNVNTSPTPNFIPRAR